MAQFRRSKKVGPFRFTLSQRGISASVGKGPLRISRGADGKYRRTVRIPGSGLYDTKVIGASAGKRIDQQPVNGAALLQNLAILLGGGLIGLLLVFGLAVGCNAYLKDHDPKYRTPPPTTVVTETTVVTVEPSPTYSYIPRTTAPAPPPPPSSQPPPSSSQPPPSRPPASETAAPVPTAPTYAPPPEPQRQQPRFDADQYFLALASQVPGVVILDPMAMTASARNICNEMQYGGITPEQEAINTTNNSPGMTLPQARALVSAATAAYCP